MFFWLMLLSATFPLWAAKTWAAQEGAGESTLESNTEVASEGYLVLTWNTGGQAEADLVIQRSRDAEFSDPAERSIPASGSVTITGLENGEYHFRAGSPATGWSPPVTVEVRHHSLARAFSFFTLGVALFAILIVTIFTGHRATRTRILKGAPPEGGGA